MRIKAVFLSFFCLAIVFSLPAPALARKKIVRSYKPSAVVDVSNAWVRPKLRNDRHALLITFGNMQMAEAVDYTLTYTSAEVPQGVQGSHNPQDGNTLKELVFGTGSGNDWNYHTDIIDMILTVIINQADGSTATRRYQINP